MAAAKPVLSFKVILESYASITIDDIVLSGTPLGVDPPPLLTRLVGTDPSSQPSSATITEFGGIDPANLTAQQAAGLPPTIGTTDQQAATTTSRPWSGWFRNVYDNLIRLGAQADTKFETPSIDEDDLNWYGTGTIDGVTDPITFTPTITGTSAFGRAFGAGDYILWNDPTVANGIYSYEIDKITAINANNGMWTLQRRSQGGAAAGTAQFGSPVAAHTNSRFYRLVDEVWNVNISFANGPQLLKLPWDNMCVAAVVGTPPGGVGTLVNLAPAQVSNLMPPSPGMRTLSGNQYYNPLSGGLSVGSLADWQLLPVDAPETIRSVFADIQVPPTGDVGGVSIVIYVAYRTPDRTQAGLIDVIGIKSGSFQSYSLTNRPDQRRQMPYHAKVSGSDSWTPTIQGQHDWPPGILPLMKNALDMNGNLAPGWSLTKVVDPTTPVLFVEGGYWGYIITQVGSSVPGSNLLVTLQT